MNLIAILLSLLVAFEGLSGCATKPLNLAIASESGSSLTKSSKHTAPLLDNLGNHHHPISTNKPLAQRYFDQQGLTFAYGFNHAEAARLIARGNTVDTTLSWLSPDSPQA